MKKETNTMQDYVKNKKNTKNLKWRRAPVGKPTTKRQTQLDRIERKLDDLFSRPTVQILPPSPGTWTVPEPMNPVYEKAPWWMNPNVPRPTVTCNAEYKTK